VVRDPLLVGCDTLHSGQQTCMNKNKKRKAKERKTKEKSCRVSAWSRLIALRTAPTGESRAIEPHIIFHSRRKPSVGLR
jgi:hypothetical protein